MSPRSLPLGSSAGALWCDQSLLVCARIERSLVVHRRTSDAGAYVRGYVESGVVAEDHADEDAGAEFAGLVGRTTSLKSIVRAGVNQSGFAYGL